MRTSRRTAAEWVERGNRWRERGFVMANALMRKAKKILEMELEKATGADTARMAKVASKLFKSAARLGKGSGAGRKPRNE